MKSLGLFIFLTLAWVMFVALGILVILLGKGWSVTIGSIIIALATWAFMSIRVIGPDQMAVKVILGEASFADSGVTFLPWFPYCYLVAYPKKIYNLEYPEQSVVTTDGKFNGTDYGSIAGLKVDATVYINFPREKFNGDDDHEPDQATHPLVKIYRAQISKDDKKLKDWTEDSVLASVREAFGKITWMQAVVEKGTISKEAERIFRHKEGELWKAGFRIPGISLVITDIRLPSGLEQALTNKDKARVDAEAAESVALEMARKTTGAVVRAMALARGIKDSEMEAMIGKSPTLRKEFDEMAERLIARDMAIRGRSFVHINVEGTGSLEGGLMQIIAAALRMPGGASNTVAAGDSNNAPASSPKGSRKQTLGEMREKR